MKTTHKLCSQFVDTSEKVPTFLTAILDANYHLESIDAFRKRLNRCYHTTASLKEVLYVDKRMSSLLGNFGLTLMQDMSVHYLKERFGEQYLNDTFNHCYMATDISLWELVNEITAISSKIEQHKIVVGERTNLTIQMLGGDLMFSQPDLIPNNIRQIYPLTLAR